MIDTNIIAEMMLPDEAEHGSCDAVLRRLRAAGTVVVFNRRRFDRDVRLGPAAALDDAKLLWNELLDDLTWERVEVREVADAVPDLMRAYCLQSYDAVHAATLLASGVTDLVSRDAGFTVLLPEDATLHTTRRRLGRTRARRRDACGG